MVVIFEVEKDWVQLYDSHSTPTEYLPEQTAVTMYVKSKESSDNIITRADVQTSNLTCCSSALSASLSRRGLGTRKEGLWRQKILSVKSECTQNTKIFEIW